MTFIETKLWKSLPEDIMQDVHSKIGPGFYKSPVANTKSREKKETNHKSGIIKHYVASKGFGFIASKGTEDIFFHISEVVSESLYLSPGDLVLYEIGTKRDGKECAKNIIITG